VGATNELVEGPELAHGDERAANRLHNRSPMLSLRDPIAIHDEKTIGRLQAADE